MKCSYVDYPWQKRLNFLSIYSDFGANGRLYSSITGRIPLDINMHLR